MTDERPTPATGGRAITCPRCKTQFTPQPNVAIQICPNPTCAEPIRLRTPTYQR